MDILAVQVDDVVDVKEIKVRKVQVRSTSNAQGLRTVKPKAVDIPIVLVNPVIREPVKSTYHYTSNDFTINFDD